MEAAVGGHWRDSAVGWLPAARVREWPCCQGKADGPGGTDQRLSVQERVGTAGRVKLARVRLQSAARRRMRCAPERHCPGGAGVPVTVPAAHCVPGACWTWCVGQARHPSTGQPVSSLRPFKETHGQPLPQAGRGPGLLLRGLPEADRPPARPFPSAARTSRAPQPLSVPER